MKYCVTYAQHMTIEQESQGHGREVVGLDDTRGPFQLYDSMNPPILCVNFFQSYVHGRM